MYSDVNVPPLAASFLYSSLWCFELSGLQGVSLVSGRQGIQLPSWNMSEKECSCRLQVDIGPWSLEIGQNPFNEDCIYSLQTSHFCFRHGDKADEYKEQFQELQDAYERICRHVVTRTSSHMGFGVPIWRGPCSMRVESFYMDELTLHKSKVFEDDESLASKTAMSS